MNIKILILLSSLLTFSVSCTESPIDKNKGKVIANDKLKELSAANYFFQPHVDVSILPEPKLEYQENDLLVDYKDTSQNVWIVVTVHPDGSAEVSHTRIND